MMITLMPLRVTVMERCIYRQKRTQSYRVLEVPLNSSSMFEIKFFPPKCGQRRLHRHCAFISHSLRSPWTGLLLSERSEFMGN